MTTETSSRVAWISTPQTWLTHAPTVLQHQVCDAFTNLSEFLKSCCEKQYSCVCVHASLMQNRGTHQSEPETAQTQELTGRTLKVLPAWFKSRAS